MYLIIDQGTSSTKTFLFNDIGKIIYNNNIKHSLYNPSRNHIECDAVEILNACISLIKKAVKASNDPILSMGLSVQRSTFLFWDKKKSYPLQWHSAGKIVGQKIL